MTGKKAHRFHIPDLKAKIRTLEAVFGEKFMRSDLNPRTVDKWLREAAPAPYLSSLKRYFGVIGMKESDMILSKTEFSKRAADIHSQIREKTQVRYAAGDVIIIYNQFLKGYGAEPILLEQTLKTMQKETIRNDYLYLKGEYHLYHYWKSADPANTGKIHRALMQLYDFDEVRGLINARIMTAPMKNLKRTDWWLYEGWIFNIKNKLFCLFECVRGMLPEIVTFHIFKPSFWLPPERFHLYGILCALSLEGIPCASNVVLKKIIPEDNLKEKLGYFSPEDIRSECHDTDIPAYLDSKILSSKPVA